MCDNKEVGDYQCCEGCDAGKECCKKCDSRDNANLHLQQLRCSYCGTEGDSWMALGSYGRVICEACLKRAFDRVLFWERLFSALKRTLSKWLP